MAASLLAASAPVPASAHTLGPRFVSVWDGTSPHVTGVHLRVDQTGSMPWVTLRVSGPGSLEIPAVGGEPFLRVSPDGSFVNSSSPSRTLLDAPNAVRGRATRSVRWTRRSPAGEISWFEPRAEYPYRAAPADVVRAGRRATIYSWTIPVNFQGEATQLTGHVDWVPAPINVEAIGLLVLIAVGLGVVVLPGWIGKLRGRTTPPPFAGRT